eukprot:m.166946 g.166946  ORF g.166946 m.166946 type:complete len:232 (-) comp13458_c0_seq4:36-731(-)
MSLRPFKPHRVMRMTGASVAICVVVVLFFVTLSVTASESALTYTVEHSFGSRDSFIERGTLNLLSKNRGKLIQNTEHRSEWADSLYSVASRGGDYFVRITSTDPSTGHQVVAESFASACSLYVSGFSDSFILYTNSEGFVYAFSMASSLSCPKGKLPIKSSLAFRSSVSVANVDKGPSPLTEKFIEEKQKKEEQEAQDPEANKSFLEKYWIYIVLFVGMQIVSAFIAPQKK